MISSMTGYGHGEYKENGTEIAVEIKSVNNRFLDISLRLPHGLSVYEGEVRELIAAYVHRGRVNVGLTIKETEEKRQKISIDHSLLDAYIKMAQDLKEQHHLSGDLMLEHVLALPDVITFDVADAPDEKTWLCAQKALRGALEQLVAMRQREGLEIEKDFNKRIDLLEKQVQHITKFAEIGPAEELAKLKERVKRLIQHEQIDEYRLELELALIADKIDISEECIRFMSHITLFREMVASPQSQGRQLNFLLQEMNREANTMASKAYTAEISHNVVKMKEEIEKIREQVQNIE
ncbi:YicC family protein [candidate division KSB1 bacterium]|nr:YicC family protein [candidate division KSB1 bacterium]RQW01403.1 MAG: YicC family protein [candidate division KSB1 bacterium]